MLHIEILSCPRCHSENIERIKRPTWVKLFFGNYFKNRYQCSRCKCKTYSPRRDIKNQRQKVMVKKGDIPTGEANK